MANQFVPRTGSDPSVGMRATHTWTEEELPKGYREGVNMLWPNGKATLTGLLAKTKKVRETQSHFMWFEKKKATKSTTGTTASTIVAKGDLVTVTIPEAFKNMVREGHEVLLRTSNNHSLDVVLKVTEVIRTANPTATGIVKTAGGGDVTNADRFLIIGNMNPEASIRPTAISYNAYERSNYQQIWRTSCSMSRTDLRNKSRIGDRYRDLKTEAWQDHAEEQEGVFLWGEKDIEMGDNGMPERMTGGIIPFIRDYAPQNYIDCAREATYMPPGATFKDNGLALLEERLIKTSFDWGEASEKIVFAGNSVLGAIQTLVRGNSQYTITNGEKAFGINVSRIDTPFGSWLFHRYTPFNLDPSLQRSILVFELGQLVFHYTDDFHFEKDEHFGKGGGSGLDGLVEAFLTEGGLEIQFPEKAMYCWNFGLDSLL